MAVKTLTNEANANDRVKFLREAAINGQFHHQNVVRLHGVVTVGFPVLNLTDGLIKYLLIQYLFV